MAFYHFVGTPQLAYLYMCCQLWAHVFVRVDMVAGASLQTDDEDAGSNSDGEKKDGEPDDVN